MVIFLAILIEAICEYIKSGIKVFTKRDYKTAVTQILVVIISVFLCVITSTDIFRGIIEFNLSSVGEILTGVIISRGANYVSDFSKKLNIK